MARPSDVPTHPGASAAAPASDRYAETEAPPVTSTAPPGPGVPPGVSHHSSPAAATATPAAAAGRRPGRPVLVDVRSLLRCSMIPNLRTAGPAPPLPNGIADP
ncbi:MULTISPECIES: hypothetical protein [Streptomyces]|uniref:Uncharacterized protein n=1 Tax=Streptomyces ehimensis TaxID=68195 RepID=A0ABV9BEA4_9ACTN